MKKLILSALAVFAVAGSAFAGPSKEIKQVVTPDKFFQDNEFALDVFYSYNHAQHRNAEYSPCGYVLQPQHIVDGSGGGVGANAFFARYFGVGLSVNMWDGMQDGMTFDCLRDYVSRGKTPPQHFAKDFTTQVMANLIIRCPIELTSFGLAPYVLGGAGAAFGDGNFGVVDVGAGIEVRLTPHIGVFTDYTWNFPTGDNRNDFSTTRAGLRFVF